MASLFKVQWILFLVLFDDSAAYDSVDHSLLTLSPHRILRLISRTLFSLVFSSCAVLWVLPQHSHPKWLSLGTLIEAVPSISSVVLNCLWVIGILKQTCIIFLPPEKKINVHKISSNIWKHFRVVRDSLLLIETHRTSSLHYHQVKVTWLTRWYVRDLHQECLSWACQTPHKLNSLASPPHLLLLWFLSQ